MNFTRTEIKFTGEEFLHILRNMEEGFSLELFGEKISGGCKEPLFSSEDSNDQDSGFYPRIVEKGKRHIG